MLVEHKYRCNPTENPSQTKEAPVVDFYVPDDLRPLPGVSVEILRDVPSEEISVRFKRGGKPFHEKTYITMAWSESAYASQLEVAKGKAEGP